MLIGSSERDSCLAVLRNMAYASDEAMYSHHLDRLETIGCVPVLEFFRASWHDVRSQWVEGLKEQHLTLGESTVQRLESVAAKMKSVCCEIASLQQFFLEFRTFLSSIRADRTHHAMMLLTRKPTTALSDDLLPYRDCLTAYAFRMVHQQYTESLLLGTCSEVDHDIDTFVFASTCGTATTRLGYCSCRVYTSRKLPCKHLLYVRRIRGAEFDESVFDSRWKRSDYVKHCQLTLTDGAGTGLEMLDINCDDDDDDGDADSAGGARRPRSEQRATEQAEKYRKAHHMTDRIALLCAKPEMPVFSARMRLLQKLYDSWSKGSEVALIKLENAEENVPSRRRRGRPRKHATKWDQLGTSKGGHKLMAGKTKRKYRLSADGDDAEDVEAETDDGENPELSDDIDSVLMAIPSCLSGDNNAVDESSRGTESRELVTVADDSITCIADCIPEDDDGLYVIVPENSGLLMEVAQDGAGLEVQPLEAINDVRIVAPPARKRGRPPKNVEKVVPAKFRCYPKVQSDASVMRTK